MDHLKLKWTNKVYTTKPFLKTFIYEVRDDRIKKTSGKPMGKREVFKKLKNPGLNTGKNDLLLPIFLKSVFFRQILKK